MMNPPPGNVTDSAKVTTWAKRARYSRRDAIAASGVFLPERDQPGQSSADANVFALPCSSTILNVDGESDIVPPSHPCSVAPSSRTYRTVPVHVLRGQRSPQEG